RVAMRRTLVLVAFVAIGLTLVALIEPPRRVSGPERVRGPRPFRTRASEIRRVELTVGDRALAAERAPDGSWALDGAPAPARLGDALDALATEIAGLRAIDAFRPEIVAPLGLDPPEGSIVVTTSRGVQRLALGGLNNAGSAVYARRGDHRRVLQVGVYLVELVRRVFEARDADSRSAGRGRGGYRPEMG